MSAVAVQNFLTPEEYLAFERKLGWNVPRLGWVKDCAGASPIIQSDIPTVVDTPPLYCLRKNV